MRCMSLQVGEGIRSDGADYASERITCGLILESDEISSGSCRIKVYLRWARLSQGSHGI